MTTRSNPLYGHEVSDSGLLPCDSEITYNRGTAIGRGRVASRPQPPTACLRPRKYAVYRPKERRYALMKSKFDSKCVACRGDIHIGESIEKNVNLDKWVHDKPACLSATTAGGAAAGVSTPAPKPAPSGTPMVGPTKSCMACPSYLNEDEARTFFGSHVGAPMCARYGKVLGVPGMKSFAKQHIATTIAADCDGYGLERPIKPGSYLDTAVFEPDLLVVAAGETADDSEARASDVRSCMNCANYIAPVKMREETGFQTGLCAATGRLLLDNRLTEEAEGCDYRRYGFGYTGDFKFASIKMYADAELMDPDPIKAFLARKGKPVVDPREYPTDQEVEPEDMALGIRAWRRITSPDGMNHTFLPIFDDTSFAEEELALVPRTGDDTHPEWYVDVNGYVYQLAVQWMELDESPALWGSAGTGKTELLRHMAWLMNLPFIRINLTEFSEVDDIIGSTKLEAVGDEGAMQTTFIEGRLTKAWGMRCVVCNDEANVSPDGIWQVYRALTDNSKQLVLDLDKGQVKDRNAYCFFALAMNPAWDPLNVGVKELGAADGDRLAHIEVSLPPLEVEEEIIRQRCRGTLDWEPDAQTMKAVMKVAADIRAMVKDGQLPVAWGIRPNIKAARQLKFFDPITAYKIAVANNLEPDQREAVLTVVRSAFKVES